MHACICVNSARQCSKRITYRTHNMKYNKCTEHPHLIVDMYAVYIYTLRRRCSGMLRTPCQHAQTSSMPCLLGNLLQPPEAAAKFVEMELVDNPAWPEDRQGE